MAKFKFFHNFLLLVQYVGKCTSTLPLKFWNKIGGRSIFQKNIHFRLIFYTLMAGNEANLNKCIIYFYFWPKLLSIHFPISWVIPNFELLSLMNYSVRQKFDFVQIGLLIWPLARTEINLSIRQEKSLFWWTAWGSMLAVGNYRKKFLSVRSRAYSSH